MKIFKMKLKDLFARNQRGESIAPRDVLFDAQLPFFRNRFGNWLKDVEKPTDGGPYVFRCEFPDIVKIRDFKETAIEGNWGAFDVIDIKIRCDGVKRNFIKAAVYVDLA